MEAIIQRIESIMYNIHNTTALNGHIDANGYMVSDEEGKVSIPFYLANLLVEISNEIEWYRERETKNNSINGVIKECEKSFPLSKKTNYL